MKVSLITAVRNCAPFISCCIDSVDRQDHDNIEYIVIDGQSTDGTREILEASRHCITILVSEKDDGYYPALNRGIGLATGDIIGILNADDFLADKQVISTIVENFGRLCCDAVYGNLDYVNRFDQHKIVRKWRSGPLRRKAIQYGWMPPHPTIYFKREVYRRYGDYSESFGYCSDYELILRMFYKNEINAIFIDRLLVKMRMGGMSNSSLMQMMRGCLDDYRAVRLHDIPIPLLAVITKKLRKIEQLL